MNLLESFKNYLFSQDDKPTKVTVKNYLSDINHFINWYEKSLNSSFLPTQVSYKTIETYRNENIGTGSQFSSSTMDRHLSSLRKFFSFLKTEGTIIRSPFEAIKNQVQGVALDPYHVKDFKNFLFTSNSSHLTIKNYLIDIKQFFGWAEEVSNGENVLNNINPDLIREYKERLMAQGNFSPATINRKLSSLRKYFQWATGQSLIGELALKNLPTEATTQVEIPALEANPKPDINISKPYSKFPPLRILQKTSKFFITASDKLLINPLAGITEKSIYLFWRAKGKPIFAGIKDKGVKVKEFVKADKLSHKSIFEVSNLKKEFYAPLDVSTKNFPWYKKTWFNLRYKRPKWYKTYHSYPIVHYFHFAVLMIFVAGLALGFYNGFVNNPSNKAPALATGPVAPPRVLSFQGRLTDNNDNPITSTTLLRFAIYNDLSASGSALLWQEQDGVVPDSDGIFNVVLGNVSTIPQSLFAQNSALWLGVTVLTTSELTPRQPLATVAYATNAETLQGMAPTTQAGTTSYKNVVLALDSSGNFNLNDSVSTDHSFQVGNGQFTLSGQPLLLTTNSGSGSNVQITTDGLGKIDLQKPLQNSTLNNNIAIAAGSVEVDDLFSVLATSSGQSAFTINQNSLGPLITASASGFPRFSVNALGTSATASISGKTSYAALVTNNDGVGDLFTASASGLPLFTVTQAGNVIPGTSNGQDLGSSTRQWRNIYGNAYFVGGSTGATVSNNCVNSTNGIITSAGSCPAGAPAYDLYWTQTSGGATGGVLFPNNSTVDLLIGSQSTSSALFSFTGVSNLSHQTQASISGQLVVVPNNGYGGNITTVNNLPLTISPNGSGILNLNTAGTGATNIGTTPNTGTVTIGNTTGDITLGADTITASSLATITSAATLGVSATTLNLGNGSAATIATVSNDNLSILPNGSGILNLNTAGTGATNIGTSTNTGAVAIGNTTGTITLTASGITANQNSVIYNGSSGVLGTATTASTNLCLLSGASTPSWGACSSGAGIFNFWTDVNGTIYPTTLTDDLLIGGNSSPSATFHVYGTKLAGTSPVASIAAQTSFAALVVDQTGVGDILTASASGLPLFTLKKNGYVALNGFNPTIRNTATNTTLEVSANGSGTLTLNGNSNTGNIQFFSSSNTIDQNGNLTIAGDATISGNDITNTTLNLGNGSPATLGTVSNDALSIIPNGTGALNLATTNTGAVSIGNSTGTITLTGSGITANTNSVLYSGSSGVLGTATTGSTGLCLVSGAATPSWSSCPGGTGGGYWTDLNGTLYPATLTDDLLIGGNASTSATFHVYGANLANQGTVPVASIGAQTSFSALVVDQKGVGNLISASASGLPLFTVTKSGNVQIGTYASQPSQQSNGLVVSGNVGIGTNNPLAALDIAGSASLSGNLNFNGTGTNFSNILNSSNLNFAVSPSGIPVALGGLAEGTLSGNAINFSATSQNALATGIASYGAMLTASVNGNLFLYTLGGSTSATAQTNKVQMSQLDSSGNIGSWTNPVNLTGNLSQNASAIANNIYLYAIGGTVAGVPQTAVQRSTITSSGTPGAFSTASNGLPQARQGLGAFTETVAGTSYLYAIGGLNGNTVTTTVQRSTLTSTGDTGAFTTAGQTQLPTAIRNFAVAQVNVGGTNYVYFIGGNTSAPSNTIVNTVYKATIDASGNVSAITSTGQGTLPVTLQNATAQAITIGSITYLFVEGGDNGTTPQTAVYQAVINLSGNVGAFGVANQSALTATTTGAGGVAIYAGIPAMPYIYIAGGNPSYTTRTVRSAISISNIAASLQNTGNVGIGLATNSASFKLQIAGNLGPDQDSVWNLGASSSARWNNGYFAPTGLHIQCLLTDGCAQNLDWSLATDQTTGTFGIGANVGTTQIPDLNITQGGTFGFNTTLPLSTLDVRPNFINGGTLSIASVSGKSSFAALVADNSGVGDLFTASASGATRFVITNQGNVGIGTSVPSSPLHIKGSTASVPLFRVENSGSSNNASFILDATSTGNSNFGFSVSGTQKGTIGYSTASNYLAFGNLAYSATDFGFEMLSDGSFRFQDAATSALAASLTNAGALTIQSNETINGTTLTGGNGSDFTITTVTNGNLLLHPAGTGLTAINSTSTPLSSLDIRGNSGTISVASVSGRTSFASLVVDQTGVGDIITASSSAVGSNPNRTQFKVTNLGAVWGRSFVDLGNSSGAYFLTPAATGLSLQVAGTAAIGLSGITVPASTALYIDKATLGNTAVIINQQSSGDLIAASASGTTNFLVKNNGDTSIGPGGAGKLTAGTLDPLYTIEGGRYSTYGSSMVGVKEEISGDATLSYDSNLSAYAYKISLNNQPVASDLWLFSKVTSPNINLTTVLLTPDSDAKVWYAKDPATRSVTFYADRPTSLSYRLTGARFDYSQWGNISDETNPNITGLIVPPSSDLAATMAAILSQATSSATNEFTIAQTIDQAGKTIYSLVDSFGNAIKIVQSASSLIAANIQAGLINASEASINSLSAITASIQNLTANNIVSPIASIDTLHTNVISPIGSNPAIALKFDDNKLSILNGNTASNAAVTSFDNLGNATFSGNLKAQSLAVASDATISGTLHAGRILASDIVGLNIQASTVSANYITNVTNVYNSSSSANNGFDSSFPTLTASPSGTNPYALYANNYINIASYSSQFAYVDNLSASTASFTNGLMVFGPTSLSDTSVVGQLSVNGSLILANNSINVLGSDLNLQPLRQGGLSIMAGLIYIDTNGNVKFGADANFEQNVTVKGTLAAGIISPLANNDLTINLGKNSSATGSAISNSRFVINNASNSAIFAINQFGNLIASGEATFGKLNIGGLIAPALAVSDREVIATGSAGIATISAHLTEITIDNTLITDKSLIYITPKADTSLVGQLFLMRQTPGKSFTVGIANPSIKNIPFNWIIVN